MPGGVSASLVFLLQDLHQHHHIVQSMFTPTAQPAYGPIVEPGAQRDFSAKSKEFRFQPHVSSGHSFVHTFMPFRSRNSKSEIQGRVDVATGNYFVGFFAGTFSTTGGDGAMGNRSSIS